MEKQTGEVKAAKGIRRLTEPLPDINNIRKYRKGPPSCTFACGNVRVVFVCFSSARYQVM
jgi:hypothetical protein